jgi:hypothetical protein
VRPQYTTEPCGACGKKKAYVSLGVLGSVGTTYWVKCMACKAEERFLQHEIPGVSDRVWPGSLAAAALQLRPTVGAEEAS